MGLRITRAPRVRLDTESEPFDYFDIGERVIWDVTEGFNEPGTVTGYNRVTDRYTVDLDSGTQVSHVHPHHLRPRRSPATRTTSTPGASSSSSTATPGCIYAYDPAGKRQPEKLDHEEAREAILTEIIDRVRATGTVSGNRPPGIVSFDSMQGA